MDLMYGMCTAAVLFPIACTPPGSTSPRPLPFKDAFALVCHAPWPGYRAEDMSTVQRRALDASALYMDYLRVWHEECDAKLRGEQK